MFYETLLTGWFALAGLILVTLFFVTAPYGRHSRGGWGPAICSRWGWFIMESVSPVALVIFYFWNNTRLNLVPAFFVSLWVAHYIHRAFIYPFHEKRSARPMPVVVMLMGVLFNLGNAYLNGHYLNIHGDRYLLAWFCDPRFILGFALFVIGFVINRQADTILMNLRSGDLAYRIPYGGMFKWVSSANYLGEIIEWSGWAVMTWSLAGLSFAVWTLCNLLPRAWAHHRWYRRSFPDYPRKRKALIPLLF